MSDLTGIHDRKPTPPQGGPHWAGFHLLARMEDRAECMLILIGATPEGEETIGVQADLPHSSRRPASRLAGTVQ